MRCKKTYISQVHLRSVRFFSASLIRRVFFFVWEPLPTAVRAIGLLFCVCFLLWERSPTALRGAAKKTHIFHNTHRSVRFVCTSLRAVCEIRRKKMRIFEICTKKSYTTLQSVRFFCATLRAVAYSSQSRRLQLSDLRVFFFCSRAVANSSQSNRGWFFVCFLTWELSPTAPRGITKKHATLTDPLQKKHTILAKDLIGYVKNATCVVFYSCPAVKMQ